MGKMHSSVKRAQKGTGHGWPALISYDDLFTKTQNLIVDGVLTLEFEVMIINPPYANIHFHEFFVAGASWGFKVAIIHSVNKSLKDCSKLRKHARQQEVQRLGSDLLWRK